MTKNASHRIKRQIIHAYDPALVRWYCTIRFLIINMRILEEIEQYIPANGTTLDIGCGFGLFSLFFALSDERRTIVGFDLNARRVELATKAAKTFGVQDRVTFQHSNVLDYQFDRRLQAAVCLDLLHHIPADAVDPILDKIASSLEPGGVLIVKDIDASLTLKTAFTWLLDKVMDPRTPVNYATQAEMTARLKRHGFTVYSHQMVDILPYPHVIFICRKA